jgi:hypothetical protein
MKQEMIIDGEVWVKKVSETPKRDGLEYCIVRTYSAGVFAGWYDRSSISKVGTVYEARRLWYWDGATSLSQLALEGVKKPENCKFPAEVSEVDLTEIIEVLPCTKQAKASIAGVAVWEM